MPSARYLCTVFHRHDFVGTDQLPVVFQLSHGREFLVRGQCGQCQCWFPTERSHNNHTIYCFSLYVQLKFEGVTVERDGLSVVCPSKPHVFTSVFIGDSNPPRQVCFSLLLHKWILWCSVIYLGHNVFMYCNCIVWFVISTSRSSRCTDFTMVVRYHSITWWTCLSCLSYSRTILTTRFYAVSIPKESFFLDRQ